jgi:hypothetical protein
MQAMTRGGAESTAADAVCALMTDNSRMQPTNIYTVVLAMTSLAARLFKKYYINSILYFSNKAHAPMQQQIFHIFLKLKFFVIQTDCKASLIASSG